MKKKYTPLTTKMEWSERLLEEYYLHIERIAKEKFKLDTYTNQLELISSEQMLEAYSRGAMPIMYDHWSTGMREAQEANLYRKGHMGLAYEVVINSDPCISYLMKDNTMMMQILVMAHAAFGHNHFFKNNYLFKQWTNADAIIDYLSFAKKYIMECENLYGEDEVESVLDAAHALQAYGVDKYKKPRRLSTVEEQERADEREEWRRKQINVLWDTIPHTKCVEGKDDPEGTFPPSNEENLLYFIEKNAPKLEPWKRELIRIVRKLAQYFYPQTQTQLMNEGFASFMHYSIVMEMADEGLIDHGYVLEFLDSHTSVVFQPDFDHPYYNGINPYALGFAIYQDIKRVSMEPTEEDLNWFKGKKWVGNGKWLDNILWAAANFKDESFVLEFLSPKVMRDFKFFRVCDDDRDPKLEITAIHNNAGYRRIRESLSNQYNRGLRLPEIHVAKGGVDVWGDRSITLEHVMHDRIPLDKEQTIETLQHLMFLWGYDAKIASVDRDGRIASIVAYHDGKKYSEEFIREDA